MDKFFKAGVITAGGFISVFVQEYSLIIILVVSAIMFDYTTGLLKAKILNELNSKKGFVGLWKKLALFTGLAFGIFLDVFIPVMLQFKFNFVLPFEMPIGAMIGIYIVLLESVSICENLYACGFKVPAWIVKMLKVAQEQIAPDENKDSEV